MSSHYFGTEELIELQPQLWKTMHCEKLICRVYFFHNCPMFYQTNQ